MATRKELLDELLKDVKSTEDLLGQNEKQKTKATAFKKHGQHAISLFRRGLDHLQHLFINADEKSQGLLKATRLLVSCS